MCEKDVENLSYTQLSSSINPSFWNKFTELKLDVDKLNEKEHEIWGYCSMVCRKECNASILEVDSTSFNEKFNGQNSYIPFHGSLINKNTLEQFKECNKIDIINEAGKIVLERIKNESVLCNPSILNSFLVLSFADLKKYHYYYWFAFPVPRGLMVEKNSLCSITEEFSEAEGQVANFIALHLSRTNDFSITCHKSIIYKLKLPSLEKNYTWVGWEKNERDKMGPRLANLKNTLDPYVIAENSIDLNLKLMKWRILPDINLEKVKETKCLILGSGTLGCSVARILLAWGVRTITFVDNSTVSFSNPVRQSLFTYLDSVKMKPKALAAADNLRTIFPGVKTEGVQLAIPMPGHTIGDSLTEQTVENVNKLKVLIDTHDMIFLLMDSRESRWLPTLLANSANKIVINAALGFDTYLVMRHGIRDENNEMSGPINSLEGYKCIKGTELGCYFCNDVTAPGNTLKDRTLDQQCTVTRPGVSHIAGALAVELAISVLQHKDGARAPAFYKSSQNPPVQDLNPDNECLLGLIPHTIRGFLSSFEQILPATEKYKHCVACSDMVLKEYSENGMDFLLKVFNSSKHLEDVTKLTEMFKEIDFGDVLEFSDEDFQ
ncbi:ubiquitin-like modifier-activating enzyme ATG7 isoform X2 [Anoplophora glabripennis]|uniref:ubiquitin-like modifier-activating enzyme ATG7 isoform X2 n=1 Tax=Anoplophora glabripennis TaxID=217634 RepID=UPI000874D13F|nr:ubiquitin-like modifier-activating enzyme ATG7 isoform X2 [Anoplophora glabripennis]